MTKTKTLKHKEMGRENLAVPVSLLLLLISLISACTSITTRYYPPPYQGFKPEKKSFSAGVYFQPILSGVNFNATSCYGEGKFFHVPCGAITMAKTIGVFNWLFSRVELIDFPYVSQRIEQIKQRNLDMLLEVSLTKHNHLYSKPVFFLQNYHAEYEIKATLYDSEGKRIWEGIGSYITGEIAYNQLFPQEKDLINMSNQSAMAIDESLSQIIFDMSSAVDSYALPRKIGEKHESAEQPKKYEAKEELSSSDKKKVPEIEILGAGTGFVISKNLVATAAHILEGAANIVVYKEDLQNPYIDCKVLAVDTANDIAILLLVNHEFSTNEVLAIDENVGIGEEVYTIGYPLVDVLGSKPGYSKGNISSTFGIKDDPRFLRITVPIQLGNSGGPLLNNNGFVVGMVLGKLNEISLLQVYGSLPENVNFAIKSGYISLLAKSTGKWRTSTKAIEPKSIDDVVNSVVMILAIK